MIKVTGNIIGPAKANYGLGNQLFQIATIVSYAKDCGYDYFISDILNQEFYGPYVNTLLNVKTEGNKEQCTLHYYEPSFYYCQIPPVGQSICLNGYFQSYKYFEHNKEIVLQLFKLEVFEKIKTKYKNLLNSNCASLHIRRGDYLNLKEFHGCLSDTDYYNHALNMIEYDNLLIFSDDIEWCKTIFNKNNTTFIEDLDYNELLLMSMCQTNIIANSTFSWWGAWLNQNHNAKIIAPKNWFGWKNRMTSIDLLPPTWIQI